MRITALSTSPACCLCMCTYLCVYVICRLDQLGAAKGMRSTSAIRRRLRTATAPVKNTLQSTTTTTTAKPAHSDQQLSGSGRMRSKEKTPGEVLSSFFLNYKKDRKVLLER